MFAIFMLREQSSIAGALVAQSMHKKLQKN